VRCSSLCSLGFRGLTQSLVASTKVQGASLVFVSLVGIGSASHFGGEHDRRGRSSGLSSLGRRWLSHALWWRARQVKSLPWPLLAWSAWAQPAYQLASTKAETVGLASVRSVVVGSARHCDGRQRQVRALPWHLCSLSAWAQPATVVAGTKAEGAALASVRLVRVG
jgi:hypothetical protein